MQHTRFCPDARDSYTWRYISFTYIYLAVGIYNGPRNIIRIGVCATVRIQTYTQTIITYTHTSIYPCNSMHISYNSMRISLYKL